MCSKKPEKIIPEEEIKLSVPKEPCKIKLPYEEEKPISRFNDILDPEEIRVRMKPEHYFGNTEKGQGSVFDEYGELRIPENKFPTPPPKEPDFITRAALFGENLLRPKEPKFRALDDFETSGVFPPLKGKFPHSKF